jgi:hypothetical protein
MTERVKVSRWKGRAPRTSLGNLIQLVGRGKGILCGRATCRVFFIAAETVSCRFHTGFLGYDSTVAAGLTLSNGAACSAGLSVVAG